MNTAKAFLLGGDRSKYYSFGHIWPLKLWANPGVPLTSVRGCTITTMLESGLNIRALLMDIKILNSIGR